MLAVPEFEVWHVDVHNPVHPLDAFEAVVSRGVIHERQTQPALHTDHERFKNLRHHVLRRDEVDVVAADLLQIEHDLRKLCSGHFCAFAELAGLEVLEKDAAQIAPAEKDCARAVPTAQTIFFSEMRERAGYSGEPSTLADANLVVVAIDLAIARANLARSQRFNR